MSVEVIESRSVSIGEPPLIIKALEYLPGGVTLDVSGWSEEAIPAGTPVIRTAEGAYKPLEAMKPLPAGSTAVGLVTNSTPKGQPIVSILTRGQVNARLMQSQPTSELIEALPSIAFSGAGAETHGVGGDEPEWLRSASPEERAELENIAQWLGVPTADLNEFERDYLMRVDDITYPIIDQLTAKIKEEIVEQERDWHKRGVTEEDLNEEEARYLTSDDHKAIDEEARRIKSHLRYLPGPREITIGDDSGIYSPVDWRQMILSVASVMVDERDLRLFFWLVTKKNNAIGGVPSTPYLANAEELANRVISSLESKDPSLFSPSSVRRYLQRCCSWLLCFENVEAPIPPQYHAMVYELLVKLIQSYISTPLL